MNDATDSRELEFEDLLTEFTERVRRAEQPQVSDYLNRYPHLAESINDLFPLVLQLEGEKRDPESATDSARWKVPVIDVLGDYRLVREIGRGGMGVVYEARQASLDRRVAMKVLREDLVDDPKSMARFQREGRMAAMLHHSNIVPVLGTGLEGHANYIVMQLVDGVGLDQIIALLIGLANGLPGADPNATADPAAKVVADIAQRAVLKPGTKTLDWQKFARLALQVSQALGHAHEKKVIHRDIKPSNLILDRSGKPWIVDFGLARSFASAEDVSRVVGTPRYMAPEQVDGNAMAVSDLYGLGLSLYELAARLRVFDEDSSANAGPRKQRPALPSLTQRVPEMPGDLANIITKCVATDPADRYADADALSQDLQRFLDRRPLVAVRTSRLNRLLRWVQRNPSTAIASTIAVLLIMGIAMLASFSYWNEHYQRMKTEATLQVSMDALDQVYDRLAPDADSGPLLTASNAGLLNDLLMSYDKLGQLDTRNMELRMTAANANLRVGEIQGRMGQRQAAWLAFNRAIELYQQLARENPGLREQATLQTARCKVARGRFAGEPADPGPLQEALAFIEAALNDTGFSEETRRNLRFEMAQAWYLQGVREEMDPDEATPEPNDSSAQVAPTASQAKADSLDRCIRILQNWRTPAPTRVTALLAQCYAARSNQFFDEDYQSSIQLQESLIKQDPDSRAFRLTLANFQSSLDPASLPPDLYASAHRSLNRALRSLASLDRTDQRVRKLLRTSQHNSALLLERIQLGPDPLPPSQWKNYLGNSSGQPLDAAVKYARQAVALDESESSAGSVTGSPQTQLVSLLRMRNTFCRLLWARNLGNDRAEAEAMVANSLAMAGAINLSTNAGRTMAAILQELRSIPEGQ